MNADRLDDLAGRADDQLTRDAFRREQQIVVAARLIHEGHPDAAREEIVLGCTQQQAAVRALDVAMSLCSLRWEASDINDDTEPGDVLRQAIYDVRAAVSRS